MGTDIRPELSEKNEYWIDKHKYYELRHFCMQYPIWKKQYAYMESGTTLRGAGPIEKGKGHSDPVANLAIAKADLRNKIQLVERTVKEADPDLYKYLLISVTEGYSFSYLKTIMEIPCGKDMFYDRYHKFFWLLAQQR